MATPKTPGAKRGRPRKAIMPFSERRAAHRPKKDFFHDLSYAQRDEMAWALSLKSQGRPFDNAAKIVCQAKMRKFLVPDIPADLVPLNPPGKILVQFDDVDYPGRPATISGAALSLERQITRYTKHDLKAALWLQTKAQIWTLAFNSSDVELVMQLAAKINDTENCEAIVENIMEARRHNPLKLLARINRSY
jgi:hypothetical protein